MIRPLALLLVLGGPLAAEDLLVAPTESIQAAIDAASEGDRVLVQPGTYVERIDFHGKAIEVVGVGGPTATTLDGGGVGPVVRFESGETPASRLQGFTVQGGVAGFGAGGISCSGGGTPTIEDTVVRDNRGKTGGGLTGAPILRRCSIVGNTSSLANGGGIYGAPQMTDCIVAANTATAANGGGIYVTGGSATITDSVVLDNGAIFADSHGGGIYVDYPATLTLTRTIVAGNWATGGAFTGRGGGILAESTGVTLESCTVVQNSVSGSSTLGAGVHGPVAMKNCIVRDNLGGPDVTDAGTVSYSDVAGGWPGVGNVDLEPVFVDALARDFHLGVDSPLVDLGDPALVDGDGSRSDIGAHPLAQLYDTDNVDPASWTDPAWPRVSGQAGGHQALTLQAGAEHAGLYYHLLGSVSGTSPGFPLLGVPVPLNLDAYLLITLLHPGEAMLVDTAGDLDASGTARASIAVAPGMVGLAGVTVWHAGFVADLPANEVLLATNPVVLTIVP